MSRPLIAVREAAIDGRLHNIIYRQSQLEKLQQVLLNHAELVEEAIRKDSGHSDTEVAFEYVLTLQALKDYYNVLDENDALRSEYAIARSEDYPNIYDSIGIVYIVPTSHTFFYSVIVGISAAIAAGNCVVIELANTLKETPTLLRNLIKAALDPSIIEFVNSRASDKDLGQNHIRIFQNDVSTAEQKSTLPNGFNPIVSPSESSVVAVVDRTADVAKAARELGLARCLFNGNSPYAPDIILVNEFVKTAFLAALTEELVKLRLSLGADQQTDSEAAKKTETLMERGRKSGELELITSTSKVSVLEVKNRKSEILRSKIKGPNLIVHSVRSLDDSIDLANRTEGLMASYIFASPTSAKYLGQFIQSQVLFVNQASIELLVGPAAPRFSCVDRSLRYPIKLLSAPRTEYIATVPRFEGLKSCLRNADSGALVEGLRQAKIPLASNKKRSGGGQVGYFEQGIFVGLGMFGVPSLLCIGTLAYFGVQYGLRLRS